MSNIDKNLLINKIEIPEAVKPIANYSPFIITNNLIFISGQIPISSRDIIYKGKLGAELGVEEGKKAAKLCILNTFGVLKLALEQAREAAAHADSGRPIILFSPACASFDQYLNFEKRGNHFRELVKTIISGANE